MSSNDIAIKVENISKRYRIGLKEKVHDTFGGAIIDLLKSPLKNYKKYHSLYKFDETGSDSGNDFESPDIIWALRDVSFEVNREEVIGVIGKNGSGKSTLLKILSRITDPTSGRAEIRGGVSSLLEVGTGFNHELTGRENVYLNGAILGMRKNEIEQKFDEIIDFSGVGKFVDTPVKRYSSGMLVRLAFAVAAHLEPEILIVDEVLAVGDADFQKKCLGKMGDLAKSGRTVLLVSHNMGAITNLCGRALWLENGKLKLDGYSSDVVKAYLHSGANSGGVWSSSSTGPDDMEAKIKSVRILSEDNQVSSLVDVGKPFKIEISYDVFEPIRDLSVTYHLFNSEGTLVFESMDTDMLKWRGKTREPGRYLATCNVSKHLLMPGSYNLSVHSFIEYVKIIERQEGVLTFDVSEIGYSLNPGRAGVVCPAFEWDVSRVE